MKKMYKKPEIEVQKVRMHTDVMLLGSPTAPQPGINTGSGNSPARRVGPLDN